MADEPKPQNVNFTLDEAELDALDIISKSETFLMLQGVSRRMIMRYALLSTARVIMEGQDGKPATRGDFKELVSVIRGLTWIAKMGKKAEKEGEKLEAKVEGPVKAPKLSVDDDRPASGICAELGGTEDGNSCTYDRYEVMASGRAVSFSVTEPLGSLTESDIAKQYSPSRDAWEAAKAKETK